MVYLLWVLILIRQANQLDLAYNIHQLNKFFYLLKYKNLTNITALLL